MRTPSNRKLLLITQKVNIDVLGARGYALEQVKRNRAGLRYGEVEAVLASIYCISPAEQKAFRAKLRHMRNIGIPDGLGEPGKGAVLRFSKQQVLEMLISLDLQAAGWAPYDTSFVAKKTAQAWKDEQVSGTEEDDIYAVMVMYIGGNALLPKFQPVICKGTQKAIDMITQDRMARLSTIINITASAKALDEKLGTALWS